MDEIDRAYRENIRDALNTNNIDRLSELLNGNYEYASEKMARYRELNETMMRKIRNGLSTDSESAEAIEILDDCMRKANLSGYHK